MADTISSLTVLTDDSTLTNQVDVVDGDEQNTHRTNYRTEINLQKTVSEEQDKNYASATAPTLKSEGKVWCDTTTDPALLKYYKDGSSNDETLVGTTLTQTLTNKTFTSPVFTAAGGKASLGLGRDLNLKITNGATATTQVDITFDYLTLYGTTGLAAVESKPSSGSALTLTITGTGSGGRAASENSTNEKASDWYYIYVYSDGAGTISGLLALTDDWATVISNGDNPSGSNFVRRVGAVRNDSSSDFLNFDQIDDWVGIESESAHNVSSTTTTSSWVSTSISGLVPTTAIAIAGLFSNGSANNVTTISSNDLAAGATKQNPNALMVIIGNAGWDEIYRLPITESQVMYIRVEGGSSLVSINSFRVRI